MATREEILKYLSHRLWGNVVDVRPSNECDMPHSCHFCRKPNAELIAVVALKLSNIYQPVCSDFVACEARAKKQKEDEQREYAKTQEYLESLELPGKE